MTTAHPDSMEALRRRNEAPGPLQKGIAFMRPISAPGYIMTSKDTATPNDPTKKSAFGGNPACRIPIVAMERMIKRERLIAPKAKGDLILKNALGNRHKEFDSAASTNTEINTNTREA